MLSVNASRRFEQQQLLESLRNYDPWGRAGGGAPTGDTRRHDLLSRYIYPQNQMLWRDAREQIPPGLRPRQRPRRSYLTNDMRRPREVLTDPPDLPNYELLQKENQTEEPQRKFPHVWSSEPWDSRGPWGGRGPGGRPWRPAGHVGRNFHQSMGWTTGDTFHFPKIKMGDNKENLACTDKENGERKDDYRKIKMPVINRSSTSYDRGLDRVEYLQRKENIDERNHKNGKSVMWDKKHHIGYEQGQRRAGGTPTRQLLQMTGGIELVPLMRARNWSLRQNVPHENFSSQFFSQLQKKPKATK